MSLVIASAFALDAYWTFDETYTPGDYSAATWTDEVNGLVITGYENDTYPTPGGKFVAARIMTNFTMAAYSPLLAIDPADDGISIWFWLKKTTATNPTSMLFRIENDDSDTSAPEYSLYVQYTPGTNSLKAELFTATDDFVMGDTATISVNPAWAADWAAQNWCFVCVTYTKADMKLRLYDGVSAAGVSAATAPMYAMDDGNIVASITGSGAPAMDELGISMKSALTVAQVAALYNAGTGLTWPDVLSI